MPTNPGVFNPRKFSYKTCTFCLVALQGQIVWDDFTGLNGLHSNFTGTYQDTTAALTAVVTNQAESTTVLARIVNWLNTFFPSTGNLPLILRAPSYCQWTLEMTAKEIKASDVRSQVLAQQALWGAKKATLNSTLDGMLDQLSAEKEHTQPSTESIEGSEISLKQSDRSQQEAQSGNRQKQARPLHDQAARPSSPMAQSTPGSNHNRPNSTQTSSREQSSSVSEIDRTLPEAADFELQVLYLQGSVISTNCNISMQLQGSVIAPQVLLRKVNRYTLMVTLSSVAQVSDHQ